MMNVRDVLLQRLVARALQYSSNHKFIFVQILQVRFYRQVQFDTHQFARWTEVDGLVAEHIITDSKYLSSTCCANIHGIQLLQNWRSYEKIVLVAAVEHVAPPKAGQRIIRAAVPAIGALSVSFS